jgi:hypothetical protein
MKRAARKRFGFLLIEIIVVLVLIAAFLAVAAELFSMAIHSQADSAKRDEMVHHVDFAVAALRRDVWGASTISAKGASLQLREASGVTIAWRYTAAGALVRAGDGPEKTWGGMPPVEFSIRGPAVTLHMKSPGGEETVALISQIAAASRGGIK